MPTRRITRSPVKVTGTAPDGQQFESTLEEDFFVLLRFNRLVETFEAQPVTIDWLDNEKKMRKYTPDVLVHYRADLLESARQRPLLCEIKPDLNEASESPRRRGPPRTENEEENKLKWAAAERFAAKKGWDFDVVRESQIRTPYLKNARFLLRHLERSTQSKHDSDLLTLLADRGQATLGDWVSMLSKSVHDRARILPACYRLIATQEVNADLSNMLTLDTVVKALSNA
jgi:hypothetical protein